MRYILYSRPILEDLSQGSRIRFIRIFRHLSQENVSDDLRIFGENKRRTMTRYENGNRNPSDVRLKEISKILLVNINLIKNYDFKNHPFLVEKTNLEELIESIRDNGLLVPLIVRKKEGDKYEMISGHRRKMALQILGVKEAEVEVKELSDEEAIIYMVDSNLYREKLLPSEKAFAYKTKLDAIKHQGKKSTCTYDMSKSSSFVGKYNNDSREKVRKYIRLTFLIPELLKIVDDTVKTSDKHKLTMGILPAVELSYLFIEEQKLVYSVITYEDRTPISFDKDRIVQVLPFNIVKRDKRYIEAYIINAIKEYKNNKFNIHNSNFD